MRLLPLLLFSYSVAHAEEPDLKPWIQGFDAVEAWRVDEARAIATRLMAEQPEHPLTFALAAEVKMHLGDYRGAVDLFREARHRGAPEQVVSNEALAEAARVATEGYQEVITEHFVIRYVPGKDAILLPYAIETLEASRERIGGLLGWKPEGRVLLELYPSASTLAKVSTLTEAEIANSGTIALCRWNRLMVTTPRAVVFGYSWRDTIAHEMTHLIIGGASKNTVPIWLHEGIAKYAETAWRAEPGLGLSVEQQRSLVDAAKKNKLIPFEKMHPSMAKLKSQEETSLAFAEVFTFIEYLVAQKGWEGIRLVMQALAQGATDIEAVEKVYGEPMGTLTKKWMATLKTRPIKTDSRSPTGENKVVLKDRPDAPDDSLHGLSKLGRRYARSADLLFARGRLVAAQKELEKAHAETKSPLIGAKLAMVALAAGDLKTAESAARASIDGTPDLAGPNVTLAEVLVRAGNPEAAREPLARAVDINPFDPRIHQLTLLVDSKNEVATDAAKRALALISGQARTEPPALGKGGLVRVDGKPFARVFLRSESDATLIPTGLLTPTSPFAVRPGTWELELVPAVGPPEQRTITVEANEGAPQAIDTRT